MIEDGILKKRQSIRELDVIMNRYDELFALNLPHPNWSSP